MLLPYLFVVTVFLGLASTAPNHCKVPRTEPVTSVVNQTICNGEKYVYQQLAGYGFLPSDARDKFGDTIGGIGSSIALDVRAWHKTSSGGYTGKMTDHLRHCGCGTDECRHPVGSP